MAAPRTCECMTCAKCRAREWARERYRLKAYNQWHPNGDLDAVRRHLLALQADGVGLEAAVRASGVSRARIHAIRQGKAKWVGRDTAAALLTITPEDAGRLPAFRVTRRLRALNTLGYSTRDLAARMNVTQNVVSAHLVGERAWVHRVTFDAVCALYETLCMTPGPNATSRRIAAQKGWAPPLAWEEGAIDDPHATPDEWRFEPTDREAVLRDLLELGADAHEACRRLDVKWDALERWCQRNGHRGLWAALVAAIRTHEKAVA